MNFLQLTFLVTAAAIIIAAVQVVTARNLVHAALWLIAAFFGMAIVFVLLDAGFLAAVQVVVYIGAISILIIFAIMLTRRVMQDSGPQTNRMWPLAAVFALALLGGTIYTLFLASSAGVFPSSAAALPTADNLVTLGSALSDPNQYAVALLLVGVLLAVGMVGAITVARDE